jgi:predicted RNase H-like HicB family nuclease
MVDRYTYLVTWLEDEEEYVGRCKEFPLMTAFGETQEEAISEIKELIATTLEILEEDGDEIPKPISEKNYSGKILLRLPRSLHKKVFEQAENDGVSVNTFLNIIIAENVYQSRINSTLNSLDVTVNSLKDLGDQARMLIPDITNSGGLWTLDNQNGNQNCDIPHYELASTY